MRLATPGSGSFDVIEAGQVRSEALLQRAAGTAVAIESRAILQGDAAPRPDER